MNCLVTKWIQVIMTKFVRFLGVLNTESLLDPCGRSGFEKAFRGLVRSGSAPSVARCCTLLFARTHIILEPERLQATLRYSEKEVLVLLSVVVVVACDVFHCPVQRF